MVEHDTGLHQEICQALGKAQFFERYLAFASRFGFQPVVQQTLNMSLPFKVLARVAEVCDPQRKSFARDKVVWLARDTFNGWDWHGVVVIQRGGIMETMFEGDNGRTSIGSTVLSMGNTAARLCPGSPQTGPPYCRPYFDGDERRLATIIGELTALFRQMNAIIRRDLPDLPRS